MSKKIIRKLYRWYWNVERQEWNLRLTPFGRNRAFVAPNGVWHTWDKDGSGGENSKVESAEFMRFEYLHFAAKEAAFKSCIKQGFI